MSSQRLVTHVRRVISSSRSASLSPTVSHHLKVLARARLVSTRREGNSIFYRRVFLTGDDPYRDIKESVFDQVDRLPLSAPCQQRIRELQAERSQQSLDFFNRNAEKFREQQGLSVLPAATAGLIALLDRHQSENLNSDRYVAILTGRKS